MYTTNTLGKNGRCRTAGGHRRRGGIRVIVWVHGIEARTMRLKRTGIGQEMPKMAGGGWVASKRGASWQHEGDEIV